MTQKLKSFLSKEIPSKWALAFIVVVAILFMIVTFWERLKAPEWMLPYTFYAFVTATLGFAFWIAKEYLRDRFELGRMKKRNERRTLDGLRTERSRCKSAIEENIKNHIHKNDNSELMNLVDWSDALLHVEERQTELQKYNEEIRDYNLFRKYSESFIINSVERNVQRRLPKTLGKNGDLPTMLCSEFFMLQYFNGEPVTCNTLRDTEPVILKNINKNLDESERSEIDILFKEINDEFQHEEILVRFRKQKEVVIDHGMKIAEELQKDISSIDQKLRGYLLT